MDNETIKKGLTKYIKSIIKPKVDYEIVIKTRKTLINREEQIFYILFIIDHSKFWRGNRNNPNPNFSQEYNDEINKIYMDEYLPELETSVKLFGVSDPDVRQEYKHTNKSIYDPLIKSLNNDYNDGDFRPEFLPSSPALGLEFIDVIDTRVVQEQLEDEGFDIDDIAFY
jgi:hypothetical protein